MRVAIAGKGGAGKTTLTATAARLLAADGRRVVLIDGDSNPNLGVAVGIDQPADPPILPPDLVSRAFDGPALTEPVDEVLATHAVSGPDGIRLTHMGMPGHAEEGCLCSAHAVVSATLNDIGADPDDVALVDMEASPEHLSRGTTRHVDLLLLVVEPYFRSLETARRMAELAEELPIPRVAVVANKLRDELDREAVTEFCERHELPLAASVPWSDRVLDADRDRRPLVDHAPSDPVVVAVRKLLDWLPAEDRTHTPA